MPNKILLVEDDAIIAMAEISELEKYDYTVHHVTTGEKAVQAIIDDVLPVDLILMDINLGSGIDGTQAAEQILNHKDIPVVFLSSHTEPKVVEKTEKITSYGYVVKNSGIVVLDTSIKMAFRLFNAKIAHKQKEEELRNSDYRYRMLFENMNVSFALHEVIYDDNDNPVDYRFLDMNPMFLDNLGCTDSAIRGHTAKELFPNTEQYWIDAFGEVAKTGESVAFQNYSSELDQWFNTFVFSPQRNQFAAFFIDITEQKRAEAELKNFKSISENAVYGNAIADLQGNLLYTNRFFANIHGYEPEDLIGKHLSLFHSREQIEAIEKLNVSLMQEGNFKPTTVGHRHRDGTEFTMLMSGILLKDHYSTPQYMAYSAIDITAQMQTAENYRLLFNYSNDAIFVHEIGEDKLPGKNIEVNEQASKLIGYSREELLNISAKDVVPEKHASSMYLHTQELMEKKHLTFETENIRKDGVVIPIEVSAYSYRKGGKDFVVSSVRDISERKRFEQELISQKQYLETILQTSSDGFWVVDSNRNIIQVNDAYCRMSGYSKEEFRHMTINDLDAEEKPEETDARIRRIIENGSEVFETKHRRKDGSVFDAEVSTTFLRLHGGQFVCFCRDITERKKHEKAIQKALQEKDCLMRELNHRVKNNLVMVSSLISLKDSEVNADLSDLKQRIDVIKLVHEKLHQQNDVEQIEVKEYFQELLESIFFTSDFDVDLVNYVEEVSLPTKTAISLGLVVNEIATNAIKYGFTEDEDVRFSLDMRMEIDSKYYILTLSNTGNPFPEEKGLENPETMGLQLISTLVNQLDGTIELQKKPNPVFTIKFPIEEV